MLEGVKVIESKAQKDELILEGTDVQNVSQSGMSIEFLNFELQINFAFSSCIYPGHLQSPKQGYPKILGWYICIGTGYN